MSCRSLLFRMLPVVILLGAHLSAQAVPSMTVRSGRLAFDGKRRLETAGLLEQVG